jgi:hypothetical protein
VPIAEKYKLTRAEMNALLRDLRNILKYGMSGVYAGFAEARDKGRGSALRRDREAFPRFAEREVLTASLWRSFSMALA